MIKVFLLGIIICLISFTLIGLLEIHIYNIDRVIS